MKSIIAHTKSEKVDGDRAYAVGVPMRFASDL
jgi:hypothetical protein